MGVGWREEEGRELDRISMHPWAVHKSLAKYILPSVFRVLSPLHGIWIVQLVKLEINFLKTICTFFFSDSWHSRSAYSERKMDWEKWKENNTKWTRSVYSHLCRTVTILLVWLVHFSSWVENKKKKQKKAQEFKYELLFLAFSFY